MSYRLPFSLESLEILDAIDRRGSYAAAAEELSKVPSALSYATQKLEEQLGVTLFEKQGRRSVLTSAGRYFLNEGRNLLAASQLIAEKTKELDSGWESVIRISIDTIVNPEPFYHCLKKFCVDHPHIDIDIEENVLGGSWERLIHNEVDLLVGTAGPIPEQKGIAVRPWTSVQKVFCVAKDHPLTKVQRPLSHDDIKAFTTVVIHDTSTDRVPMSSDLLVSARRVFVPSFEHKILAQRLGLGIGFLSVARIQAYLDSGELVALDVEGTTSSAPIQQYLAWKLANKGRALKALTQQLAEMVIE